MNLDKIERMAKIEFKKIGAPQPAEIIKATARDMAYSFDNVAEDILPNFQETAELLEEKYGKEDALMRALAIISGYTKEIKQRSLLMSAEGYITVVCNTREEVRSLSFVWGLLRENFPHDLVERVKGMKLLANNRGCAFDLSEQDKHLINEYNVSASRSSFNFNFPYELPELVEEPTYGGRGGGRGYGRNGGGFGGRNGGGGYGRNGYGGRNSGGGGGYGGRNGGGRGGRGGRAGGGDDDSKVFCGNLGFNVENKDLIDFFSQNNVAAQDAYVIKRDGESRGFGYAQFSSPDEARRAQQLAGKMLSGRSVRIGPANRK